MKDCWIQLPLASCGMFEEWYVVRAKIVDVAPHLPGTYAAHKVWTWRGPRETRYSVFQVETGTRIEFEPRASIDAAEQAAREVLADKTAAQVLLRWRRLPDWVTA